MRVSVIIPNYNGAQYLKECLKSLSNQTYRDFEIIIVDNASTDNSCELVLSRYPQSKLIILDKNYGFSKAVNEGIIAAEGEYVVLLNNDTEVKCDWLHELINCINKDEDVFSCCSKMMKYSDKNKIDNVGDLYTILGWALRLGAGHYAHRYEKQYQVFSSCAGAAIYRKSILEEIGYFDENFFAYMEDVDIGYRAKINGYKNIYCPDAVVYHIGSATSGSKYNSFKVKLAARNNIYVIYKNMPALQIIINFPFLLIGFLIKWLFFTLKGFGKEYFQGLVEGFRGIKNIDKVKFERKHLINYVKIEIEMIINTFKYIANKIFK